MAKRGPKPAKIEVRPPKFYHEQRQGNQHVWWRDDWFGDQFDIISAEGLNTRIEAARLLGFRVQTPLPNDD